MPVNYLIIGGIGYKKHKYGMLLLVSVGDRKAHIELGAEWAEEYDAQATNVIQSLIIPAFKRKDYSTGVIDGVRGMDATVRGLNLPKATLPAWFWPAKIVGSIFFVLLIIDLFRSGRSGWAWAAIITLVSVIFFMVQFSAESVRTSSSIHHFYRNRGGATGSW